MKNSTLTIQIPDNFSFRAVLSSHGWSDLEPFSVSEDDTTLRSIISLNPNKHILLSLKRHHIRRSIIISTDTILSPEEKTAVKGVVRAMLRIDENFDDFYSFCRNEKQLRWIPKVGGGRMLRSATVFEDIVKMICTTNCSWALTKIIVNNLTTKLGTGIQKNVYSFPSPLSIASRSERWMRKETSSGYRAPYLLEFAQRVASGAISVEHLRSSDASTDELYDFLRTIKGVGHYAAGNILKLLGRYDYLSIDSWIRTRFSTIHKKRRKVSDASIEKYYDRFGRWRGLVCWMEMTKEWHVPFIKYPQ